MTGNRTFFANETGVVVQTHMNVLWYSGLANMPPYEAAFTAADMSSPLALGGGVSTDSNTWTLVR